MQQKEGKKAKAASRVRTWVTARVSARVKARKSNYRIRIIRLKRQNKEQTRSPPLCFGFGPPLYLKISILLSCLIN